MFGGGHAAKKAAGADKSLSSAAEPGKAVKAEAAAGTHQLRSSLTKTHFELGHDGKPKQVYPTTPLSGGNVKLEPTALGLAHAATGATKVSVTPSAPSKSSVSAEALPAAGASAPKPEVAPVATPPPGLAAAAAAELVHAPEVIEPAVAVVPEVVEPAPGAIEPVGDDDDMA
jgi:hypothetical protein